MLELAVFNAIFFACLWLATRGMFKMMEADPCAPDPPAVEAIKLEQEREQLKANPVKKKDPDDYWEEEGDLNYATGEISSDTGPSVRHPKNRDRAYSGSS